MLQARARELEFSQSILRLSMETHRNITRETLHRARELVIDLTQEKSKLEKIYGNTSQFSALTINEEKKLKVALLRFERTLLRANLDYQLALLDMRYLGR